MKINPFSEEIYITINIENAKVGDRLLLIKDIDNSCDDEAIMVTWGGEESEDYLADVYYVANSTSSVARGTYSAGRLYDKFDKKLYAEVRFALPDIAIAKILGEPAGKASK